MNTENKMLVVIDGSYFLYYILFGAVNNFKTFHLDEYDSLVKPPEETDQSSLPSLLVSDHFKKELKTYLMKRCETVDSIIQKNFPDELDSADSCDFIFAMDDFVSNSFRRKLYPEYKACRKLLKKSYSTSDIHSYIVNVLFPDLDICGKYGYNVVQIDGAEGDDVIACIINNFNDYKTKILFASDHDFCQLENVRQFDLAGSEIFQKIKTKGEEILVDSKTALLMKIIQGDKSDGIPSIAERIGPVKAYKYANNKEELKKFLLENQSAAQTFLLNKKLISFHEIPNELSEKIVSYTSKILNEIKNVSDKLDLQMQNLMEL